MSGATDNYTKFTLIKQQQQQEQKVLSQCSVATFPVLVPLPARRIKRSSPGPRRSEGGRRSYCRNEGDATEVSAMTNSLSRRRRRAKRRFAAALTGACCHLGFVSFRRRGIYAHARWK